MMENSRYQKDVGPSSFTWDLENGLFKFDGAEALLFWVGSAFRTLFDSIEEVSGDDSARVVLETAGYRMGTIVADFYRQQDIHFILKSLPITYATAGWGKFIFESIDLHNKTAVVRMKNSWEFRVNKEQGKAEPGLFLPGHWAGLFSSLYKENIWYNYKTSEIGGEEYDEIHLFPSVITPAGNIHDLIRQKEQTRIKGLERLVEERTKELNDLITDLSVPVIPVLNDILVIPLISKYDNHRAEELMSKALTGLTSHQAKYLVLDLTAIKEIDEYTISLLHKLVAATRLVGGVCILVGIGADLAVKIIDSDFNTEEIITFSTLQHGIHYALAHEGMEIVKKQR
ncbi:STAS domain-containing protein [Aneurinibacillus sp. Ricciae_BoGa-3]|uniref:STAS domain-containing protein n=1 Tax=Aneurinibacillus sp. Ricciae_BoGa-3 TaxID=3022697 RepID=UPI0023428050|nr:STAS domain-containing protein [Aneurinibacillus sp. Ricciae_BoGa-3]WCK53174.1 STAS domain-containing protein [Aneurinibacillus sp. Ricciae_BoGa-3]